MQFWLFFSVFAAALVVARLFLGHVPDRLGGAVALVSVLIEAGGLLLIWLAPAQIFGVAGALLTGLGFALVYPGLGVEAVRRAPPESRGVAMGAYTAFLDLALGFGSPSELGWIAGWAGLGSVFLAGRRPDRIRRNGFRRASPLQRFWPLKIGRAETK